MTRMLETSARVPIAFERLLGRKTSRSTRTLLGQLRHRWTSLVAPRRTELAEGAMDVNRYLYTLTFKG
jgi:hypothetical protein